MIFHIPHRKSILYNLCVIDEKSDSFDDLSEYPCYLLHQHGFYSLVKNYKIVITQTKKKLFKTKSEI